MVCFSDLAKALIVMAILVGTPATYGKPDMCHYLKTDSKALTPPSQFYFDENLWNRKGFENTEYTQIPVANTSPTSSHYILPDLSIILLKRSGWTQDKVRKHLQKTATIYRQCGVEIGKVHIVETRAPANLHRPRYHGRCFDPEPEGHFHLSKITPFLPGPRVYLINSFIVGPSGVAAFDAFAHNTPLENTIWLANWKPEISTLIDQNFDVLAHELGHILLNSGHIVTKKGEEPRSNLMAPRPQDLNDKLTPEQCQNIIGHRLVKRL